mmetsp:Transcript_33653/g.24677  ORF Transcript_33653/g.24677 Transcript_33653/m.24677 type:complete len:93 (+) Transcript_33653:557-835(+)|eukprot:CAMPEP_0202974658 /NCGR_PEP_ID=MMETSP1396-20130829/62532_1 /ASSEMBLY_ACC=CAM_ASM_000872 /TAXON_ID= /ORGANISM="Pseudokeronopsis sp., Strain Brazil" /LENGTH=92 /DNA_ID=CAMNT_0049708881 /DNA_START=556 /DNA_END=834 /DNA_ORIENTATION=+
MFLVGERKEKQKVRRDVRNVAFEILSTAFHFEIWRQQALQALWCTLIDYDDIHRNDNVTNEFFDYPFDNFEYDFNSETNVLDIVGHDTSMEE